MRATGGEGVPDDKIVEYLTETGTAEEVRGNGRTPRALRTEARPDGSSWWDASRARPSDPSNDVGQDDGDDEGARRLTLVPSRRLLRILAIAFVAAGLMVAGADMLIGKLTTVWPLHAAAAGDTLPIRASGSGVVVWVSPARMVAPGDAVVAVSTYRSHEATAKLDEAIALAEQNLNSKTNADRDVRRTFASYRQASSIDLEKAEATRKSIDEQVRLQAGRVARLSKLSARGFVSRDTMDVERSKLAALRSQSFEATRAAKEAALARASAAQGYYLDRGRATQASVLDTRREQEAAAEQLQRLQSLRTSAPPIERIEAPCRCTIVSRRVQRGEYVSEGELLLSLDKQPAGAGPAVRVEALVPLEQISKIEIGSRATVWLPGARKPNRGTVSRVSYDLTSASVGGLPKQALEMGGVALVVVNIPDAPGIPPLENGAPVRLKLHTDLMAALGF